MISLIKWIVRFGAQGVGYACIQIPLLFLFLIGYGSGLHDLTWLATVLFFLFYLNIWRPVFMDLIEVIKAFREKRQAEAELEQAIQEAEELIKDWHGRSRAKAEEALREARNTGNCSKIKRIR